MTVDDAKSISSNKNGTKTEVKTAVADKKVASGKNQRPSQIKSKNPQKKNRITKSLFARKAKVNGKNGNGIAVDANVELKEYWVDSDMNKLREMAKELIASRPTKLM